MRFIPTPAEDAGGRHTGSGGRRCDTGHHGEKKMKARCPIFSQSLVPMSDGHASVSA